MDKCGRFEKEVLDKPIQLTESEKKMIEDFKRSKNETRKNK